MNGPFSLRTARELFDAGALAEAGSHNPQMVWTLLMFEAFVHSVFDSKEAVCGLRLAG